MKSEKAYRGLSTRKQDGFIGERQILIPKRVLKDIIQNDPFLNNLYITEIGFYPKATFHYRERRWGWEDNIIFYCLDGKGWYQNKAGYCDINANEFVILPATDKYIRFGADALNPWTLCWVHFRGTKLSHFNKTYSLDKFMKPSLLSPNEKRIKLWEDMYYSLEKGYTINNISYANFCLYYFIASLIFPDHDNFQVQQKENTVTQAITYMRDHLSEILSVEEVAKKFSYSASHFSSMFRKQTGISPIDYFIHMKMQRACQLLDVTDLKIKEVASQLGYDDPYYFTRIFNKTISLCPSEYRLRPKR